MRKTVKDSSVTAKDKLKFKSKHQQANAPTLSKNILLSTVRAVALFDIISGANSKEWYEQNQWYKNKCIINNIELCRSSMYQSTI